jgi:hypothetical protein
MDHVSPVERDVAQRCRCAGDEVFLLKDADIFSGIIDRAYTNTHAGLNGLMPRYTAAQRLDRLPICPFHRRILFLIGAGMFLDYFDAMLQGSVLGALTASRNSSPRLSSAC